MGFFFFHKDVCWVCFIYEIWMIVEFAFLGNLRMFVYLFIYLFFITMIVGLGVYEIWMIVGFALL